MTESPQKHVPEVRVEDIRNSSAEYSGDYEKYLKATVQTLNFGSTLGIFEEGHVTVLTYDLRTATNAGNFQPCYGK